MLFTASRHSAKAIKKPTSRAQPTKPRVVCKAAKSDPYRILGIPRNSSRTQIRAAYLQKIRQYHPDVSMEEDAAEVAVQLNAAYQTLMQV